MTFAVVQLLGGLSYATTLFLMTAGLTLIFGVTRIVNFAHGSFFMLGALFTAHWVTNWFPAWGESGLLYLIAILLGAACAGLAGAIAEFLLLRRMSGAPELYQLVATFGLTLAMHDAMQWGFGPAHDDALSLPYGTKKRLELAVALAARPRLLLLDEPAAGLAEAERASLMRLVKKLAGQGMAVLYTEHNMDTVAGVADRVLVLIEGRLAAQGSFEEISRDAEVRRLYLGESLDEGAVHA